MVLLFWKSLSFRGLENKADAVDLSSTSILMITSPVRRPGPHQKERRTTSCLSVCNCGRRVLWSLSFFGLRNLSTLHASLASLYRGAGGSKVNTACAHSMYSVCVFSPAGPHVRGLLVWIGTTQTWCKVTCLAFCIVSRPPPLSIICASCVRNDLMFVLAPTRGPRHQRTLPGRRKCRAALWRTATPSLSVSHPKC